MLSPKREPQLTQNLKGKNKNLLKNNLIKISTFRTRANKAKVTNELNRETAYTQDPNFNDVEDEGMEPDAGDDEDELETPRQQGPKK